MLDWLKTSKKENAIMSNNPQFGFVLEYVTDIEPARRFYVEIVGLQVERYHPAFVQFKNFAIASDASMSSTRDPEVYWLVEDAKATFADFSQKVKVIFPPKQMPFGQVFAIKDPAGRPLYVLELAKNRPSQPV
jgi:predicted enzyme related to lactoylglutathione lyase